MIRKCFSSRMCCDKGCFMKKKFLLFSFVVFGSMFLLSCASEADSGTSQGISAQPTPVSSRLGIQEAQNKAIRRLAY